MTSVSARETASRTAGGRDIAQVTVGKTDTAPMLLQMCHLRATEGCGAAVVGLDVLYDHGAPGQR